MIDMTFLMLYLCNIGIKLRLVIKHRSPVGGSGWPPDSINKGTVL